MRDSSTRSIGQRYRRHGQGTTWMAVAVLAALSVGCSDDTDTAEQPSTSPDRSTSTAQAPASTTPGDAADSTNTSTSSTTAATASPSGGGAVEEEIVVRYLGFWEARVAANSGTPDPDSPALREYATGEQLVAVVAEARSNLDEGLAFAVRPNPADFRKVAVVSVTGDTAVVQECVVDDGLVIRRATGESVNDAVATHNARGELRREQGVWKVARVELVQRWDGVGGCAADS